MPLLELKVASPEPDLSVRRFAIREGINALYSVGVVFRTKSPALDLEGIVGKPAELRIISGYQHVRLGGERAWTGLCNRVELVQVEAAGLTTYSLSIVPHLWLLTQKNDYRIFQHQSIPDIIDEVLDRWKMPRVWEIDRGRYPELEFKVQYDESDFKFFSRLLEEAGISFVFTHGDEQGSKLLLSDRLHAGEARPPLPFFDHMTQAAEREFVTKVRVARDVRPGKVTLRDYDPRRPRHELFGKAEEGKSEAKYEQYSYQPGGFLVEGSGGGDTPVADDRGMARHKDAAGEERATRALAARREGTRAISFETNAIDVTPGRIFSMLGHPHGWLAGAERLLVTDFTIAGTHDLDWHMSGRAVFASNEYRPAPVTPRPIVTSVQVATVVGPDGQEIHTDEFGRVRLSFQWDRVGRKDDGSSCWIRVSQGWAGKGYGLIALPRVGQEVLVAFLNGDPDQPIVVGRSYTAITPVPRKLPDNKTESVVRSNSSPGGLGSSEVAFDDAKGDELVQWSAHKNMRRLVKNDYVSTIGHDRVKSVSLDELDTTGGKRTEVTRKDRTDTVNATKTTSIKKVRRKLIKGDESHTTDGHRRLLAGKNVDLVTGKDKRERIVEDVHLVVVGNRSESVDGDQSLIVEVDQFEKVGKNHALATGKQLSLRSGDTFVNEAGADMTIKSAGGFIRIDALGVTISGTIVRMNAGGSSPRKGRDPDPKEPEKPKTREPDTAKGEA
jgi:type VI secretion system secreted protein VgrG